MKVLVTGAKGFIAKNLIAHLKEDKNIELILFDRNDNFSLIEDNIENIDFIFHLAGVNRPKDTKEFYEGNTELTEKLVKLIKQKKPKIPLLITSSIQAVLENDYGKSKKAAEDYIINNIDNYYIFRLHNVFGKWCKPNYNSVIATFCYNISHDLEITINDENKSLELIYIDDICKTFINILKDKMLYEKDGNYCYIKPRYRVTLGYIAKKLMEFKNDMISIYVPNTGDDFVKKLFSTYVSYLPIEKMCISTKTNVDERGSFTELIRTMDSGQFSISFSKPGVIRGNHYHHTKMERFIVIKGKAKISFQNIITDNYYEFIVDDTEVKIITIPVGYTHKIENIGKVEMILIMWCNELFDSKNPDTYFKRVENEI